MKKTAQHAQELRKSSIDLPAKNLFPTGTDEHEYLTFIIRDKIYCVDIKKIQEIKGWNEAIRLPNNKDEILVDINLRGAIIPVYDPAIKFGMNNSLRSENPAVIFLTLPDRTVGIIVDTISDIIAIQNNEIKNDLQEGEEAAEYIEGSISYNEQVISILNIEKLFAKK